MLSGVQHFLEFLWPFLWKWRGHWGSGPQWGDREERRSFSQELGKTRVSSQIVRRKPPVVVDGGPDPQCPLHFQMKGQRNSKKCWTPESIQCQTPPRTLCLLQMSPAARWQKKAARLFLKSLLHWKASSFEFLLFAPGLSPSLLTNEISPWSNCMFIFGSQVHKHTNSCFLFLSNQAALQRHIKHIPQKMAFCSHEMICACLQILTHTHTHLIVFTCCPCVSASLTPAVSCLVITALCI